jgi:hypothetical protein
MRASTNAAAVQIAVAVAGALVTIGALYYVTSRAKSAIADSALGQAAGATWDAGNSVADVVTAPIASAWQKLKDVLSNSNIQFSRAEIYLNPKYFDAGFKINSAWMDAMTAGHPDIASLFRQLLDSSGRVKTQYRHLIGGVLNQKALGA